MSIKIAHAVFSVNSISGGLGPAVIGLTDALSKLQPSIATTTYVADKTPPSNNDASPNLRTFPTYGPWQYSFNRSLVDMMTKDQMDLFHCHGLWSFLSRSSLQWRSTGKPNLITLHGMTLPAAMKYSRWKKKIFWPCYEKEHLKTANCIHALSMREAQSIRDLGISTPISLIGNGIDVISEDVYRGNLNRKSSDQSTKTLLFLGRLHPIKGLDHLISAWALFKKKATSSSDWNLDIVGWGDDDYVSKIKDFCNTEGVDESVNFLGPKYGDEKLESLATADAFVLPSSSEAFPIALLEAWSNGLPCLATEVCKLEHATNAEESIFVPSSVEGLFEGLNQLASMSQQQRSDMGAIARKSVQQHYSWKVIGERFSDLYSWIINGGEKPDSIL